MIIPEMFYGTYPIVKKRTNKAIRDIIAGVSFENALKLENMLDTNEKSGIFYMGVPSKGFEEGLNFHLFPFAVYLQEAYLDGKISSEKEDEIYQIFLQTPWGNLTLLSRDNAQYWLRKKNRFQSYVDSAFPYINEFSKLGDRFETSGSSPESVWAHGNGFIYALANLGVPQEVLSQIYEDKKIPPLENLLLLP
jgi:hypothetical protein